MNKNIKIYFTILLILTIVFLCGRYLYPHSAMIPSGGSLEPPSKIHILGTDDLGLDIFSQLSKGYFTSIFIGIISAIISFIVGGLLGVMAGYIGGTVDFFISFLINLFLSTPQIPIMIVVGAFLGQSLWNIIFVVSLFSWSYIAKIVRAKTIQIKNKDYILLSKSYGGNFTYIFKNHIFQEIFPILLVNSIGVIGRAIVQESSLAFLGLSDPLSKSWGLMIQRVVNFNGIYFTKFWTWWLLPPLLSLIIVIYCIRRISREVENINF